LHSVESPPAIAVDWQETRVGLPCFVTVKVTVFIFEPNVAIMTGEPLRLDLVEKLKVAVQVPLGIVTDDGTTSPELVDDRLTVVGSPGLLRVTVQVPPEPSVKLVGLQTRDERLGVGSRVIVTAGSDGPTEAVTTADATAVTVPAVAVKEAEVEEARTVTDLGTVRVALLEVRETMVPPVGAA
jgi:hypothetical protein